jgi:sulfoxide reductase heme-binding subunit YedZ
MTRDPSLYTWWLVSRAAGITAFAMASASVILGLSMAAKLARRPGGARRWRSLHEHLAVGTLIAVAIHGLALLADPWLHPGVAGVLLPFGISYRPLAVAGGIVAGYGMAVLGLTFYARRRLGTRRWRSAHRFTILFWALAATHALTAGSDASTPWMRAILGGSVTAVVVLFAVRLRGGPRRRAGVPRATATAGGAR